MCPIILIFSAPNSLADRVIHSCQNLFSSKSIYRESYSSYFDLRNEFPNYFLPKEYRSTSSIQIPEQILQSRIHLLEFAVASILRRVTLPMVLSEKDGLQVVRYFENMKKIIAETENSSVQLLASGGVVRSVIGYVYSILYEKIKGNPQLKEEDILQSIINDTSDLPGLMVRGVGSDWDVLLKFKDRNLTDYPQRLNHLCSKLIEVTNSAETLFSMRNNSSALKKSIFSVADVKEYEAQITRATSQGGSTIDFLSFDVEMGKFVEPPKFPGIIVKLIKGYYSYEAPSDLKLLEDGPKQTIRGLRASLELPFLKVEDEKALIFELKDLLKQVQQGFLPSAKALDQFNKMIRNARYGGAHNRFYRALPGTLDSIALELAVALTKKSEQNLIPEFVDHFEIPPQGRDLNGLPEDLVIHNLDFEKIFHGTSNVENSLAIIRGGFFISKAKQGVAHYGRGAYASSKSNIAQSFAGSSGVVFEVSLVKGKIINILDWEKHKDSPVIKRIEKKAQLLGRDIFEYLSSEHGIDIILNTHILIENAEAIESHLNLKSLILISLHAVENKLNSLNIRVSQLANYSAFYRFALIYGEKNLPDPKQLKLELIKEVRLSDDGLRKTISIGQNQIQANFTARMQINNLLDKLKLIEDN
jgi:hypothetical protein